MIDAGSGVDMGGNPFGTDLFGDSASSDWGSAAASSVDSFGSNWD